MIVELGELTSRIAALTSISRSSREDARREALHDGLPDDLYKRVEGAAESLRKIASDLEKAVS